eukprot:Colp12_sorted_trinity150504_noHs@34066
MAVVLQALPSFHVMQSFDPSSLLAESRRRNNNTASVSASQFAAPTWIKREPSDQRSLNHVRTNHVSFAPTPQQPAMPQQRELAYFDAEDGDVDEFFDDNEEMQQCVEAVLSGEEEQSVADEAVPMNEAPTAQIKGEMVSERASTTRSPRGGYSSASGTETNSKEHARQRRRKAFMTEKQLHSQRALERQSRARLSETFKALARSLPQVKTPGRRSSASSKNTIAARAVDYIHHCDATRDSLNAEREKLLRELEELREINEMLSQARVTPYANTSEIIELNGNYVYVDDSFKMYLGLPDDVVMNLNMFQVFGQNGRVFPKELRAQMMSSLVNTGMWKGMCEVLVRGHPHAYQPHEVTAIAIKDPKGALYQISIHRKVPSSFFNEDSFRRQTR